MRKLSILFLTTLLSFSLSGMAQSEPSAEAAVTLGLSADTLCPGNPLVATVVYENLSSDTIQGNTFVWTADTNADASTWKNSLTTATSLSFSSDTLGGSCFMRVVSTSDSGLSFVSGWHNIALLPALDAGSLKLLGGTFPDGPVVISFGEGPSGGNGVYGFAWETSPDSVVFSPAETVNDTLTVNTLGSSLYVRAIVSSYCGSDTTTTILIGQYPVDTVTISSNDTLFCHNSQPDTVRLAHYISSVDYVYQWQMLQDDVWMPVAGINDSLLLPSANNQTQSYRLMIADTSRHLNQISNTVNVRFIDSLAAPVIRADLTTVCHNMPAGAIHIDTLPHGGDKDGVYSYLWQRSLDSLEWQDIDSATDTTYSTDTLVLTTWFRLKTVAGCDSTFSNAVRIFVHDAFENGRVGDTTVCYNTGASLSLAEQPSGAGNIYDYRWLMKVNDDSIVVINHNEPSLFFDSLMSDRWFSLVVSPSNGCQGDTTAFAHVTVRPPLEAATIGDSQILCFGEIPSQPITVSSPFSGGNGDYLCHWQDSVGASVWTDIDDTNTIGFLPPSQPSKHFYRLMATDLCGTIYSNHVAIDVYESLQAPTIATSTASPICFGDSPAAITVVDTALGGNGTFVYQWQTLDHTEWQDIDGETSSIQFLAGALNQDTSFRLMATNGCGSVYSDPLQITVMPRFVAGSINSDDTNVCYGFAPSHSILISKPFSGSSGVFTYTWQKSPDVTDTVWTDTISGSATSFLPGKHTADTLYRIMVSDVCNNVLYSNNIRIHAYDTISNPVISTTTVNPICYGTSPDTFFVANAPRGGDGIFTYHWQSFNNDDWSDIMSATDFSAYKSGNLQNSKLFRLEATSLCGTKHSNEIHITVLPIFTSGQVSGNETVCHGQSPSQPLTLSTPFTGGSGSYSYVWEKKAVDGTTWSQLSSDTVNTLSPGIDSVDTYYRIKATDRVCGVTLSSSNVVTINIYGKLLPPVISTTTTSPLCFGQAPSAFTVVSNAQGGDGTFNYTWQGKTSSTDWIDITNNNGTLNVGPLTQSKSYRLYVTTGCGDTASNVINITVYPNFTAGSIAGDDTVCYSEAPSLPITVTNPFSGSDGNYTYTWQKKSVNASQWTNIETTSGTSYSPYPHTADTLYQLVATNAYCNQTRTTNTVRIHAYDSIHAPHINSATATPICYGTAPATLMRQTPASGGDNEFSYQWQFLSDTGWTDISGATNGSFFQSPALYSNTDYHLKASSNCGTKMSNAISITVLPQFTAGTIGSDDTVCYGGIPEFLSIINPFSGGKPTYSYLWQKKATTAATWTDISSGTSQSFTPPAHFADTLYRLKVTDGCNVVRTSDSVLIHAFYDIQAPVISTTTTAPICYGTSPAPISVLNPAQGGDGLFTYQWQQDTSGWENITGQTSSTSYSPGNLLQDVSYRLIATSSACGSDTSAAIQISVLPIFTAGIIGNDDTVCYNQAPTDSLSVASPFAGCTGVYSYNWQKSPDVIDTVWTDITSENSTSFLPGTHVADTLYRLKATDICGVTRYSNDVRIHAYDDLVAPVIDYAATSPICYGTSPSPITVSDIAMGGDGIFSYQWQYRNSNGVWNDIGGENSSASLLPGVLYHNTYYRLKASSSCGTTFSNTKTVTVYPQFHAATLPDYTTIKCQGSSYSVSLNAASGGDGNYNYVWQVSVDGTVFSDLSAGITTYSGIAEQSQYLRVHTENTCATGFSNIHQLLVNPLPERKQLFGDSNILCSNMSDLKYWVNDDDDEEYMWFIYSGFGEFLSRVDSAAVLIHWNDGVTNPFIILDVRFLSTGCENDFLYAVTIDTVNHAPQKTHIVMKKGARILICEDATANAHYSWGYVNTETGAESEIPNSDYRYVQIPDGLNLDEYDFFVEVSYGKSPCRTRTYYRKDEQGDDWWSGNTDAPNLKVMPNPSNGDVAYSIDADIDGDYSVDVYNSVGKLVFSQNGNDFIRDTSVRIKKHLDPGIYLVSITTANGVLTQKIIVK